MTIEKIEALERAATEGTWIAGDMGNGWPSIYVGYSEILGNLGQEWTQDGNGNATESVWETYNFIAESRNAIPALLAVAKAAQKSLDQLSYILEVAHNEQQDEVLYPNMLSEIGTRREELSAALHQLEATP